MPRAKRKIQSEASIEGLRLIWHLHREQQWCGEFWKGVAIHVKVAEGTHRELFLEYPPAKTKNTGWTRVDPIQQTISPKKVESHIKEAIAAGWNPVSRGRPFVFQTTELPD